MKNMEFYDITEDQKVYPGEYLLYKPKMEIVLCGAFMPSKNRIKALAKGMMIEDTIGNFQKIKSRGKKQRPATRCKGCGSR